MLEKKFFNKYRSRAIVLEQTVVESSFIPFNRRQDKLEFKEKYLTD